MQPPIDTSTATNSLGLEELEVEPRARRWRFTTDEWLQIEAARSRDISWAQIQRKTNRYKNALGLKSAYTQWRKHYTELNNGQPE